MLTLFPTRPAVLSLVTFCVVTTLAAGCLHSPELNPRAPVATSETFDASGQAELAERWWETFEDTQLNTLVTQALTDNLSLKAAWARLSQAESLRAAASASLWPQLSANAGAGKTRSRFSNFPVTDVNSFTLSAQASYEVDLWGKLSNQRQAAELETAATRDNLEAAAISLSAEVVETWFALIAQRAQLELLKAQLETNRTWLELMEVRFEQGLATVLDIYNLKQKSSGSESQLASARGQLEVTEHRLAILLGQTPSGAQFPSTATLPTLPPVPKTGLPSELLKNRPDVRAAQRMVAAADARVGIALANRFPALKLGGSVGYSATSLTGLLDEVVYSVTGGLVQPLFMGGALAAEQRRAESVVEERLQNFGQTLLQATAEVENALTLEQHESQRVIHLTDQYAQASNALREARARYLAGLSDFLPVLNALDGLQRIEQALLLSQRQERSYRIQLCRALGGSWTQELAPSLEGETAPEAS
ncbi:MAG: efflux transporter outer membrane subunit [Myxococcota bacterium]|nr:efflux transporter outer membrane subunit [Myxococcota bacterium]